MKFANKPAIIASLMFFFIKSFHIATAIEDAAAPLVITSDQEKRFLSTCAPFTHPGGSTPNDKDNWKTADDISLDDWCSLNNCCKTGTNAVNADVECTLWNTAVEYTICPGACRNGLNICNSIALESNGGGKVIIHSNACTDGAYACAGIGGMEISDIEIFSGACSGIANGCISIGRVSSTLTRIEIPANECHEFSSYSVPFGKCTFCGRDSVFEGTLVATDSCCAENGNHADDWNDVACNYTPTPPPEEPNPCKNVNCSNRGKCQVVSFTDAECKCENTFIQSDNKLDCICPSDHVFNANANRCFPITEAPTKSPTSSPTLTFSTSPSQAPTEVKDELPCEDDLNSTFTLDNGNIVDCKWILKNKKRRTVRKAKYCVREEIMSMCPVSCDACSA